MLLISNASQRDSVKSLGNGESSLSTPDIGDTQAFPSIGGGGGGGGDGIASHMQGSQAKASGSRQGIHRSNPVWVQGDSFSSMTKSHRLPVRGKSAGVTSWPTLKATRSSIRLETPSSAKHDTSIKRFPAVASEVARDKIPGTPPESLSMAHPPQLSTSNPPPSTKVRGKKKWKPLGGLT